MKTLYTTKATALAGRNGQVATDDGLLSVQLFAAGYAACFSNAVLHVAREAKIALKSAPVTAEVGIGMNQDGGFQLSVTLAAQLDLPEDQAIELVQTAHKVCPYSNATRGNIDVHLSVNGHTIA